jgi:hypothetical protein
MRVSTEDEYKDIIEDMMIFIDTLEYRLKEKQKIIKRLRKKCFFKTPKNKEYFKTF